MGYIPRMEQIWMTRIREQMAQKGYSMRSLSEAAGLNQTYIRDILERQRTPTIDKFTRVAEALGVSPSYLLGERSTPYGEDAERRSETQLRSALLAHGVDAGDLKLVMKIIQGFVDYADGGEQSEQTPRRDQSAPASRRRVKAP